ncbi:MAG TPA: MBL fold metallo-hydrolase [Pyrinomonadaceae bacterium]|nr:MBL fold metallo-hydrolase [Pyrinomonadaceae bacterium]
MKLTVFQSGKGDCMLLTGADGRNVLVDGGMSAPYAKHVAPALGKMRDNGESIDVVYLSHIDEDHIAGILSLMNDEVDWRVHEFQIQNGNTHHKEPDAPRPPAVKAIWHNAFHELVDDNKGEIENMLGASAAILSGSELKAVKELAIEQSELVSSIAQAIKLTRRVSGEQLGIKKNGPAKGKLMLVRPQTAAAIKVGGMRFRIIGPASKDLEKLREDWNIWLEANKDKVKTIQTEAKKDEASFATKEINDIIQPKLDQAALLTTLLPNGGIETAVKLGDRKQVTPPNLASLMFFVEESGKTLILTGDGHHEDVIKGLKHIKKLKDNKGLHVNVLKVQHHGSEHNIDEVFCRTVTADNYVICGNGESKNPDTEVVKAIITSRLGSAAELSPNPEVGNHFKIWINSHSSVSPNAATRTHMKKIESRIGQAEASSNGQMSSFFLKGSSFELPI